MHGASPKALALVLAASTLALSTACAGKSEGTGPASSTAGGDGGAPTAGAPAGGSRTNDPNLLMPELNPPPKEGDGRIVDIGDALQGYGWDTCRGEPSLTLNRPSTCSGCPAATRGDLFVIAKPAVGAGPVVPGPVPQAYFFFDESTHADAVWFDALWIDGGAEAKLSLWPADPVCKPTSPARVFDLHALFTQPRQWVTTCVPLDDWQPFTALALRIDSPGTLGLDAFRFGPRCPER
jgi:hypothetical protein